MPTFNINTIIANIGNMHNYQNIFILDMMPMIIIPAIFTVAVIDKNKKSIPNIVNSASSLLFYTANHMLPSPNMMKITDIMIFLINSYAYNVFFLINKYTFDIFRFAHSSFTQNNYYYDILSHIGRSILTSHLYAGESVPGMMDINTYTNLVYMIPLSKYLARNYTKEFNEEAFMKMLQIEFMIPNVELSNIHKLYLFLNNTFVYNFGSKRQPKYFTVHDIILSIHALYEQLTGDIVYSLSEYLSLKENHIVEIMSPLFLIMENFKIKENKKKIKEKRIDLRKIIKKSNIFENDLQSFSNNNLFELMSHIQSSIQHEYKYLINSDAEHMKIKKNMINRKLLMNYYFNLSLDLLINYINKIADIKENEKAIIDYLVGLNDTISTKIVSDTGQDINVIKYIVLKSFKNSNFNIELAFKMGENNCQSYAYYMPIEYMQTLKYINEAISFIYDVGYIYQTWHNSSLIQTQNNQIGAYLVGDLINNLVVDFMYVPEFIKIFLGLRPNITYTSYCMSQISHNSKISNLNLIDQMWPGYSDFHLFNNYLMYASSIHYIMSDIPNLFMNHNASSIYQRFMTNIYLDIVNKNENVVYSYVNYIFNTIPQIYLTYNLNSNIKCAFNINTIFTTDVDQFANKMKSLKSIIPGIMSGANVVALKELTCGFDQYVWLEKTVITMLMPLFSSQKTDYVLGEDDQLYPFKTQGLFSNLFSSNQSTFIPLSDYFRIQAGHIGQSLAINHNNDYNENLSNYYDDISLAISPEERGQAGQQALLSLDRFDYFLFKSIGNNQDIILRNLLCNNSAYQKVAGKYYNKTLETLNQYEQQKFMLHMFSHYNKFMRLLKSIEFRIKYDKNTLYKFNLQEIITAVMYDQLCTNINMSCIQIFKYHNFVTESNNMIFQTKHHINGRASVGFHYPWIQQPRFSTEENGLNSYTSFGISDYINIFSSLAGVIEINKLYEINSLKKIHMNKRWFNPNSCSKAKNGFYVMIKARNFHEEGKKFYIGNFSYELCFKTGSNIFSISAYPIFNLIKQTLISLFVFGIVEINSKEFYEKNNNITFYNTTMLFDIMSNRNISSFVSSNRYDIKADPLFRRYNIQKNTLIEYSASQILTLGLLTLQICNQYVLKQGSFNVCTSNTHIIGMTTISEFIKYMSFSTLSSLKNIALSPIIFLQKILYVMFYLIRQLAMYYNRLRFNVNQHNKFKELAESNKQELINLQDIENEINKEIKKEESYE